MTEEDLSKTAKKSIITMTIEKLWPLLLSIGLSAPAYLYSTSMEIASHPEYKKYSLLLLAVLLCIMHNRSFPDIVDKTLFANW
jgi:hypothetical protein